MNRAQHAETHTGRSKWQASTDASEWHGTIAAIKEHANTMQAAAMCELQDLQAIVSNLSAQEATLAAHTHQRMLHLETLVLRLMAQSDARAVRAPPS